MSARIVFDLDGTLIDSAPDITGVANALLAEAGRDPITLDQTRAFIGSGAPVFVERMRMARGLPEDMQAQLLEAFVARYDSAVSRTVCYPGVVAALQDLKAQGHRLGICTNKPERPAHAVLKHLALARFFDVVLGGDSLPQRKPDPAPLHAAFAALGPGQRLYVGDSEVDAETAQRADVPFMLFTEGYRKSPVDRIPHDMAFANFAALPGLVESLVGHPA